MEILTNSTGKYYYYEKIIVENKEEKTLKIQLTDYIIEPEYYSWDMTKGISEFKGKVIKKDEKSENFIVNISDLITSQAFNKSFNGMFLGGNKEALYFRKFLTGIAEQVRLVEFSGIHTIEGKEYYISKTKSTLSGYKVLSTDENLQTREVFEKLTQEEKDWLKENMYFLRTDMKAMLLFWGWMAGTFYQIEKEPFPFLQIKGTSQSGKTTVTGIGRKLQFGVENNKFPYDRTTAHSVKILGTQSNLTSFFLDEIKETVGNRTKDTKLSLLRSISDNGAVVTGRVGSTTLSEFRTPIILGGETGKNDISIINRSIMPEFTTSNKGDEKVFRKLKETNLLYKLGYEILLNRLNRNPKEFYDRFYSMTADITEERARQNYTYILIGNHVIQEIIGEIIDTGTILPLIIENHEAQETNHRKQFMAMLESYLDTEHHQKNNVISYDGTDKILELMDETINIKLGKSIFKIAIRPTELYLQFKHMKENFLIDNELTDQKTFYKDIESCMTVTKNNNYRMKGKTGSIQKKCTYIEVTRTEYENINSKY